MTGPLTRYSSPNCEDARKVSTEPGGRRLDGKPHTPVIAVMPFFFFLRPFVLTWGEDAPPPCYQPPTPESARGFSLECTAISRNNSVRTWKRFIREAKAAASIGMLKAR